ncbi:MAG TPA: beta-eliminating lyase-related protein [Candidatus Elarobacter sp.]|nr:beta-eliminating lyase-related protein [Candidatus Elarobacter sp.]HEV2737739.1 beta-eliminating lyase-related protein [Candidatus Elarobacter sp.]
MATIAKQSISRRTEPSPAETLRALADALPEDATFDSYGAGALIEDLEREVAALLGKEAAVFCTSGKAAQLSALRVHADRRGRNVVAAHPRSHIVEDENDAIGTLYGLRVARVGTLVDPFTLAELAEVQEPLAAVVVELPLRRTGYRVPTWDELVAVAEHVRGTGVAFHLDGARLWETAPGYGRSLAEIAALADTVYVSFYKGLGGIAGAALAGDAETVAAARVWIGRAGATLFRMYPYAVAAREGLRRELPRMLQYHTRAVEIADALRKVPGVAVNPDPPACNAFIVYLDGKHDALLAARDAVVESQDLIVFQHLSQTAHPCVSSFELVVGANTLETNVAKIRAALAELVERAQRDERSVV